MRGPVAAGAGRGAGRAGTCCSRTCPAWARRWPRAAWRPRSGCSFTRLQCTPDLLPADVTGSFVYDPATARVRVPARTGVHGPAAGRRDQPHPAQDAGRPARGHAGGPGHRRGPHVPAAPALPRARHGQPGRVRGHVPAAGGPARPVPRAGRRRLPDRGRRGRRPAPPRRRRQEAADVRRVVDADRPCCGCRPASSRSTSTPTSLAYCVALAAATRTHSAVEVGASPRGSLALLLQARALAVLDGRDVVLPEDVKEAAPAVLAHRISLGVQTWGRDVTGRRWWPTCSVRSPRRRRSPRRAEADRGVDQRGAVGQPGPGGAGSSAGAGSTQSPGAMVPWRRPPPSAGRPGWASVASRSARPSGRSSSSCSPSRSCSRPCSRCRAGPGSPRPRPWSGWPGSAAVGEPLPVVVDVTGAPAAARAEVVVVRVPADDDPTGPPSPSGPGGVAGRW